MRTSRYCATYNEHQAGSTLTESSQYLLSIENFFIWLQSPNLQDLHFIGGCISICNHGSMCQLRDVYFLHCSLINHEVTLTACIKNLKQKLGFEIIPVYIASLSPTDSGT